MGPVLLIEMIGLVVTGVTSGIFSLFPLFLLLPFNVIFPFIIHLSIICLSSISLLTDAQHLLPKVCLYLLQMMRVRTVRGGHAEGCPIVEETTSAGCSGDWGGNVDASMTAVQPQGGVPGSPEKPWSEGLL